MFAPYCERHGSKILLSLDSIDGMANDDDGMFVAFTCTCGHRGVWRPTQLVAAE